MKLPCNVIEDLLPLYHDGVCSEESHAMVEEHLCSCETCKKILENLSTEAPIAHIDDAAALQTLKKQWGLSLAKSFARGLALACLICSLIWGGWYGLTQFRVVPVSADVLEVTEVSQLKDGSIAFRLQVNDNKDLREIGLNVTDDGALYYTPVHAVLEATRKYDFGLIGQYHWINIAYQEDSEKTDITSLYVGPVGKGILIWEEGMELPPASQEMEDTIGVQAALFTDAWKARTN